MISLSAIRARSVAALALSFLVTCREKMDHQARRVSKQIAVCAVGAKKSEIQLGDFKILGKSIQVCISFSFNDRVAFAGFSFQTAAIKNGDRSSTVTN